MSITNSIRSWLETYNGMTLAVMTDGTGEKPSSYSLAPSGNGRITRDITGNTTYANNYVFYAREPAADEVDRRSNYDFLEGLTRWIEDKSDANDMPELGGDYKVEELTVTNAMLFDIDENGTGLYQVQIQIRFTKRR